MDPKTAVLFILAMCTLIVVPTLVLRFRRLELRHQERMAAFEKGIPVPPDSPEAAPTIEMYQLRGLIWLATGIGLILMLLIMMPMLAGSNPAEHAYRVRTLRELGYSNEQIHETQIDDAKRSRGLAALGIVPTAVGAAYLFFYYEQRKRRGQVKIE